MGIRNAKFTYFNTLSIDLYRSLRVLQKLYNMCKNVRIKCNNQALKKNSQNEEIDRLLI